MKQTPMPLLAYALMGLIQQKPRSGYDLRKIFAETAMGNYSSSPGAIYPALERLDERGCIRGVVEDSAGLRRRRLYRLTPGGRTELKNWLARPIEANDVMRGANDLMLRFAFIDPVLGPAAAVRFLEEFRRSLAGYIPGLESFLRENAPGMPLSARLAMENGIGGYRSLYEWTAHALREYRKTQPTQRKRKNVAGGRR